MLMKQPELIQRVCVCVRARTHRKERERAKMSAWDTELYNYDLIDKKIPVVVV